MHSIQKIDISRKFTLWPQKRGKRGRQHILDSSMTKQDLNRSKLSDSGDDLKLPKIDHNYHKSGTSPEPRQRVPRKHSPYKKSTTSPFENKRPANKYPMYNNSRYDFMGSPQLRQRRQMKSKLKLPGKKKSFSPQSMTHTKTTLDKNPKKYLKKQKTFMFLKKTNNAKQRQRHIPSQQFARRTKKIHFSKSFTLKPMGNPKSKPKQFRRQGSPLIRRAQTKKYHSPQKKYYSPKRKKKKKIINIQKELLDTLQIKKAKVKKKQFKHSETMGIRANIHPQCAITFEQILDERRSKLTQSQQFTFLHTRNELLRETEDKNANNIISHSQLIRKRTLQPRPSKKKPQFNFALPMEKLRFQKPLDVPIEKSYYSSKEECKNSSREDKSENSQDYMDLLCYQQ